MGKWLVTILLLISFLPLAQATPSPVPTPIDLIFDIDWTTFYTVEPDQKDARSLEVEGRLYRATDHLAEVIESLLARHPEIRISFFSGGERSRNEALLSSLHLSDGRSLKEVAYRIFSKEHLTQVSRNETLHFSQRYKKVITGLIPDWNPSRTLLIDDQVEFSRPPLKAVPSLGVFNYQRAFNPARANEKYFPPSLEAWQLERQKALLWLGMIEVSLKRSQETGQAFSAIAERTWTTHTSSPQNEFFLRTGERLLLKTKAPACHKIFLP